MILRHVRGALVIAACLTAHMPALSQTIYPIDRAEILAGAKFDLKVEFPVAAEDITVTINGRDAAEVLEVKGDGAFRRGRAGACGALDEGHND